jgi:uncharacterized protein
MPITALFAALLAVLLLILSARVIGQRRGAKVEIGEGSDRELLRRVRVHANFVEYTPFVLILMGLAESMKAPALAVAAVGTLLLIGRIIHAYGLSHTPHIMRLRVGGMALTFTALASGAALCAVYAGLKLIG